MKLTNLTKIGMVFLILVLPELAMSLEITRPSFITNDGAQVIDEAGAEIARWLGIAFGVMAGIYASAIGIVIMKGNMQEGMEKFQNVIWGVLAFLVGGSVISFVFS
jgi:hypothetical protein